MLAYNLHSLGIAHDDLERTSEYCKADDGKFLLIDFTASRMHRSEQCVAQHVRYLVVHSRCFN